MKAYNQIRLKVIFEVLDRFPDAGSRTLASKVFHENSALFKDSEHARRLIRYYRGQSGEENRKDLKDRKYVRKSISTT